MGMAQWLVESRPGDERGADLPVGDSPLPRPSAGSELTPGHWGPEDTVCTQVGTLPSPNPAIILFPQLPFFYRPWHLVMEYTVSPHQIHMLKP